MRDILYVTKGRREFTEHTFNLLLENTNWDLADRLIVYDDGSLDGSKLWMRKNISRCPQEHYFRTTHLGSPVSVMNDYVDKTNATWFCKIDNDICFLQGGWTQWFPSPTPIPTYKSWGWKSACQAVPRTTSTVFTARTTIAPTSAASV